MKALKVLMLGPPGAGKGVISQRLQDKYKIPQISTGDLIREEIDKKTEIGKIADNLINKGNFLPDDLTLKIVKKRLNEKDCKNGFIFDGFPRNLRQAREFEKISGFNLVINLIVPERTIIERVCTRRVCENCKRIYNILTLKPKRKGICDLCQGRLIQRKDDTEEVMKKRLEVYKRETFPLIEFYRKKGMLVDINGKGSVEEVFNKVVKIINSFLKT
jgi:adenylate kinase